MIVIVTDKIYVVSKKINYININEGIEDIVLNKKKTFVFYYDIIINFEPQSDQNQQSISRNNDNMIVEFRVYGHKRAVNVFKDMVSQIREQCPDQFYLDKILDNLLAKRVDDDPKHEEICGVRETKRKSKTVLRGSKRRLG